MRDISKSPCTAFTPFPGAPEVCDDCGHEATTHPHGGLPPDVGEALWRVMFKYGGTPSTFGGPEVTTYRMPEITAHIAECGIDWQLTEPPHLQAYSYTADSFAEPTKTEILAGTLWCRCSRINFETIAIDGRSLGQLMWMAAHIDDD